MTGKQSFWTKGGLRFVPGVVTRWLDAVLDRLLLRRYMVYGGDGSRLAIADTAIVNNALFNVVSGSITVGEWAFFGHNVCVLTGTHDYTLLDAERLRATPGGGRDVVIGRGVWIGSCAVIVGPCRLGDHCVVAPGSVVTRNVPSFAIVGGVPAERMGVIARSVDWGGDSSTEE